MNRYMNKYMNKYMNRYISLIIMTIIISAIVILAGCVNKTEQLPGNTTDETITIKYVDINSIVTKDNFPDFELLDRIYYVARENTSVTLEVEGIHGESFINFTKDLKEGYRIYGISEAYNSSKDANNYERYILLQYKVFDNDKKLNDSLNLTAVDYMRSGFKNKVLNSEILKDKAYKGRIFVFETNMTNRTDVNVTIILFKYDTLLGKIGVQDSKDKSFNESLNILDTLVDKLQIKTKIVKPANFADDFTIHK